MRKKINRKTILICCFLILCLSLSGCPGYGYSMGGSYSYNVYNINGGDSSKCEEYYYLAGSQIIQFSIADQEITRYGNGEYIEAYAMCDEYIIFLANRRETRRDPDELWKYNRVTESFELLLEMEPDRIHEVEVCKEFILYGDLAGRHVYACPIEGNPETDSISLSSLLEMENRQEWQRQEGIYRVREIYYQGLIVLFFESGRNEYRILGILDEDSGEVIWNVGFIDNNSDLIFWGEGEWIIFSKDPGSNFYYQREGETERHRIECLDDPKYENTGIKPSCLTMEGNCVFGLMSVHRTPLGLFAYDQAAIENDILFELNLETKASKIIFETESAQTRIIGYKNGLVYLLEDDVIYRGWIDKQEREKIYDLQEEGWELYDAKGQHINMGFHWQGDDLIVQSGNQIRSVHISN